MDHSKELIGGIARLSISCIIAVIFVVLSLVIHPVFWGLFAFSIVSCIPAIGIIVCVSINKQLDEYEDE